MTRSDEGKARRELQVTGSFLFLLGAGFVLDRAFVLVGWLLALAGAALLLAAARTARWPRATQAARGDMGNSDAPETSAPSDPA